jgi:hypothetical protein
MEEAIKDTNAEGAGDDATADDSFIPFHHYASIANSYREKEVSFIRDYVPASIQWIALEKVHGCNFSATTNGTTLKWGSRTAYIGHIALSQFYNSHVADQKYNSKIKELFFHLKEVHSGLQYIRVFGELYGGVYRGIKNPYRHIQKEVLYTPDIEFIVYDIQCIYEKDAVHKQDILHVASMGSHSEDTPDADAPEENEVLSRYYSNYLDHMEVISSCNMCLIPVLTPLAIGSLDEMLALNPCYETTIPALHNLHSIPGNESEGYVLKPMTNIYAPRGGRIMLKLKHPKFLEHSIKALEKAKKKASQVSQNAEDIGDLTDPQELEIENKLHLVFESYVNENRVNAVISKISEAKTRNNKKAIVGLIVKDVLDDVMKDLKDGVHNAIFDIDFDGLDLIFNIFKKKRSVFTTRLMSSVEQLVKTLDL